MSQSNAINFSPPYPQDYVTYETSVVAGVKFRLDDALSFANGTNLSIVLERELDNKFDKHAIKVIGITSGSYYFVGYIPKDLADQIVRSKLENFIEARLNRIYVGEAKYVDIRFNIIGPSIYKKKFVDFKNNKSLTSEQKDGFKFFKILIPKGMKRDEANRFLIKHEKKLKEEDYDQYIEYNSFNNIHDEYLDRYARECHLIKKPKRAEVNAVLDALVTTGYKYKYLSDNIDRVTDMLKTFNPSLNVYED